MGEQNFDKIIEGGYVYIDKTHFIPLLLQNNYYFLSRPRRFGKSLFISTLEQFFLGRKDLFEGLAVADFNWNWVEFPIIRIDLSSGSFSQPEGLNSRLNGVIDNIQAKYAVEADGYFPGERLDNLIRELKKKFDRNVVILIDEYEKPLLDTIHESHHERFQKELRDFYSVLKECSAFIEFLFITGVSRFGHLNIFSGLNNLNDISLNDDFAAICGITERELNESLKEGVEKLAEARGISPAVALDKLKSYYDGYHFSASLLDIYNPFSLLSCIYSRRFTDKWFQSGSSTFLLRKLRENDFNLTNLEGVNASEQTLLGVDASMNDSITLLYQSGYLTIKAYDEDRNSYFLGLPNREVKNALYNAIIPFYLGNDARVDLSDYAKIATWLNRGDTEELIGWLKEFFAGITYDVKLLPLKDRPRRESDFQFIVYAIMSLACGVQNVELELPTSNGRMDLSILTERYIYIMEFKLGEDSNEAMRQINQKGYALRWANDGRKIIKIGLAFSPELRNIISYLIE